MVEGLVRFYDPENSAGGGMWASGRYNQAGKINGEKPDKRAVTIPIPHSDISDGISSRVLVKLGVYVLVHKTQRDIERNYTQLITSV